MNWKYADKKMTSMGIEWEVVIEPCLEGFKTEVISEPSVQVIVSKF